MKLRKSLAALCVTLVFGTCHAAEKPPFLATFDPEVDTIQFEFENQAEPGCFWGPYNVRDSLVEEMQNLGLKSAEASIYELSVVAWGASTDDYHCAIMVETRLYKFGVRAETAEDEWVSTDLLIWDDSDMLTGPKINMDERIQTTVVSHMRDLQRAMEKARR